MTQMIKMAPATRYDRAASQLGQYISTGVTETVVPRSRARGDVGRRGRPGNGAGGRRRDSSGGGGEPKSVQRPRAVTSGEKGPGGEILHRQTKRVKLNGTRIVGGEPTNREKIMNYTRSNKDILEVKRPRDNGITYGGDRDGGAVSHNDGGGTGGRRRVGVR